MRIAVAGATGIVGEWIVREAGDAGHEVLQLSRAQGVNLLSGEGLDLDGTEVVIDASGPRTSSAEKSRAWFEASTGHLLRAAAESGVKHLIALSIIGAAQAPFGYYAGKARQEELVTSGPIPWTVLQSTQFFEFAEKHVVTIGPWHVLPTMRSQPVAARTVARRLVEIAGGSPLSRFVEIAGPEQMSMADVLRARYAALGEHHQVHEFRLPGGFGHAIRDGTILPGPHAQIAGPHCKEWAADPAA